MIHTRSDRHKRFEELYPDLSSDEYPLWLKRVAKACYDQKIVRTDGHEGAAVQFIGYGPQICDHDEFTKFLLAFDDREITTED